MVDDCLELAQAGLNHTGMPDVIEDCFLRLQTVAGNAEHDAFVARDPAGLDQFFRTRHGDAAGSLCENALGLGQQFDAVDDFRIGGILGGPAGLFHAANGVVAVGWGAD